MRRETHFGRAAAVWDACENARHLIIRAFDPRWQQTDTKLRRSIDSVAASASEQDLLGVLKRLRFNVNCLPLPLDMPAMWGHDSPETVLENIRLHAEITGNVHLADLHVHLTHLVNVKPTNPLWDSINESWNALRKPVVVVTYRSSHVVALESLVKNVDRRSDVLVVKQNELPELWGTRTTIIFGPPSLGADWLKAQPRGDVVWVHHIWNRGLTVPEAILPFTTAVARTPALEDLTSAHALDRVRTFGGIEQLEETWAPFDWTQALSGLGAGSGDALAADDDGPTLVLARTVALADDQYVLVPAEEGTSVSVFNPAVARVERRAARDIRAGMFVVVRTESGRDLIRDLVESKFLENPQECFSLLEDWKRPLRRAMRELGVVEVRRALHARGVDAEEVTLRSWTTDLVYGPGNEAWLWALLEYLAIETPDRHWAALEALRRAGRKAGHYVRLQLLDQARQVDPVRARRESVLTFTLKGISGGAVKAYKVEAVNAETVEVPTYTLGRIHQLWRA